MANCLATPPKRPGLQRNFRNELFVSEESVQRYVDSYKATGLVAPASQKHGPAKLLSDFEQEF